MAGLGLGGSGGGTRLDGLVGLLDTGTNASVRRMAAGQVGDLIAAHPTEVRPVLARVRRLLLSPSWDTRVAAGHALAAIASQTPRFAAARVQCQHGDWASAADGAPQDDEHDGKTIEPTTTATTPPAAAAACLVAEDACQRSEKKLDSEPNMPVVVDLHHKDTTKQEPRVAALVTDHHLHTDHAEFEPKQNVAADDEQPWQSLLEFSRLDLVSVLESGALLFGSSGDEYKGVVNADVKEQRARLKADLGLDDRVTDGGDILDIADADLVAHSDPAPANGDDDDTAGARAVPAQHVVDDLAASSTATISARERNRMKREAKKRARLTGGQQMGTGLKRPRLDTDAGDGPDRESTNFCKRDDYDDLFDSRYFDFQPTCEMLKRALLDARWEARHGAAVGIRHILAVHSASVGRLSPVTEMADRENARWLEDVSCRLLCVLAMDRFGDFVGEAVVAPVRETAAMALATASRTMVHTQVVVLLRQLLAVLESRQANLHWELRHAVLLGTRYILAVMADSNEADDLIPIAFEKVADGLRDSDDDVRAVAAEALLPIANPIAILLPDRIPYLVATLWDALLDLDDISASTGSVLRLLTKLSDLPVPPDIPKFWIASTAFDDANLQDDEEDIVVSEAGAGSRAGSASRQTPSFAMQPLVHLVPRIWPFLRHGAVSVRIAVVSLLECLLKGYQGDELDLLQWLRPLCAEMFEHLFRNIILETNDAALQCTKRVWKLVLSLFQRTKDDLLLVLESAAPLLSHWFQAASYESRADALAFDQTRNNGHSSTSCRRRSAAAARRAAKAKKSNMRTPNSTPLFAAEGRDSAGPAVEGPYEGVAMQHNAAYALGSLASIWPSDDHRLVQSLVTTFRSPFGIARRLACDVCRSWASQIGIHTRFDDTLRICLTSEMEGRGNCPYGEVGMVAGGFFSDTLSFLDVVGSFFATSIDVPSIRLACEQGKAAFAARDYAQAALSARALHPHVSLAVGGDVFLTWEQHAKTGNCPKRHVDLVSALRQRILTSLGYMTVRLEGVAVSLSASASSALVANLGEELPAKIGPFVKALTASLRSSENPHLQQVAADGLSVFAARLCSRNTTKPLALLLKNLTRYLTAERTSVSQSELEVTPIPFAEGMFVNGTLPIPRNSKTDVVESHESSGFAAPSAPLQRPEPVDIARRGAVMAFHAFCEQFADQLFEQLPSLWYSIHESLVHSDLDHASEANLSNRTDAMILMRTIVAKVPKSLREKIASLLPAIVSCCSHPNSALRQSAALCLADVVSSIPGRGMHEVVYHMIPMLSESSGTSDSDRLARRGAANALRAVVNRLGHILIPYAAFLIVPIMMRMVDDDDEVRDAAAGIFGSLVRIMPLEGGAPDDPEMSTAMAAERNDARAFLGQLLGTHPRQHYAMPVTIEGGIHLRKYQQDCLDWLYFLNRYGLHGALCDDMGLGKTLMTLCIIAGDLHSMRQRAHIDVQNGKPPRAVLPSLVVCPSTIAAHWVQECERFFSGSLVPVCLYSGTPKVRARLRTETSFEDAALVVTSYDVLSNDLQYFTNIRWNYVALDEGHVIKNPKTRVARAVRSLSPQHRLILTGTPIQNSVLELWSLFDFLMPGFLGTEHSFKETYAKPILASRGTECTESDREKGMVATEALHRQVLPFVLRRLKDDVLSELPPKIMQDYYCNMTPLQVELYEDFSQDIVHDGLGTGRGDNAGKAESDGVETKKRSSHIFQILSYLRRLCSHPKLVLTETHPEYLRLTSKLRSRGQSLDDISSSSKLIGLQSILSECGIGDIMSQGRESGGHRVLVFAQLKQMLDLVETDLFKIHMPQVTYLRLDGSVEVSKRQSIVTRFNNDPTIDVLLLTTSVGGLGLNLVGADTVIFLEHDWNPTKDLQAMDRAHRMGQKKTVNVYRLITRGTLEEKIMGIQRFKTHIANTVVNRENSSLQSMNTETLLSLFNLDDGDHVSEERTENGAGSTGKGLKAALSGLGDLWEESQYDNEYNIDSFLAGMNRN
jgi:TATA-binding protein-associated factor